ncbi:OmpA family protein [Isoalcanivorax beigongshangi]|uniref:OmpA family protein n=1 Tax=Isoalcanivorax beigongshangi TaxID=3238810 RepID=A0ABV4AJ24_9GAMM
MNKTPYFHARRLLAVAALGLAMGAQAESEWPESFGYVGIQGSYYDIEKGRDHIGDIHNYWEPAAQVGYRFNPRFSMQLQYGQATTEARQVDLDVDTKLATLTGRVHAPEWSFTGFQPYAGLGYGYHEMKPDHMKKKEEHMVVGELGLQRLLGSHFMLDAGVRGLVETDDGFIDAQPYLGIDWLFGKQYRRQVVKEEPAPVVDTPVWVDSDGDGVPDHLDQCPNTPAGALVDEVGCPQILKESVNITLYVEFDHDSTTVKTDFYPEIERVAKVLTEYPGSEVLLEGHTDSTGSARYNQTLSHSRADAVMRVLVSHFGIGPERVRTSGMGKSQPIADNSTAEGRSRNRRVEAAIQASREEIRRR